MESCPDDEMLTAFTEGQVSSFVRESVTAHLVQCLECSEICARLVDFAEASVPLRDTEWANAEKRLENWMDGLLRVAESSRSTAEMVRVARVDGPLRAAAFRWRMLWAVAAAAVAVIVVGMFLEKRDWWMTPAPAAPVQVARQGQASPQVGAPPPVATVPSTDEKRETFKIPAPSLSGAGGVMNAPPAVRHKVTEPVGRTTRSHPPSTVPNAAPSIAANGDSSSQIAQESRPPELSPNDQSLVGSQAQPSAPSKPADVAHVSQSPLGITHSSYPTATPKKEVLPSTHTPALPTSLRLEAGTRLWINRVSIHQQPDGSFNFRGTLLQPVAQSGIVLDRGTQVDGSGSVKRGKVTVFVASLLMRGSTYKVQGASGMPSEKMLGSGKGVQFESGQVIEMWLSSASEYEKVSDSGSHDQAKP